MCPVGAPREHDTRLLDATKSSNHVVKSNCFVKAGQVPSGAHTILKVKLEFTMNSLRYDPPQERIQGGFVYTNEVAEIKSVLELQGRLNEPLWPPKGGFYPRNQPFKCEVVVDSLAGMVRLVRIDGGAFEGEADFDFKAAVAPLLPENNPFSKIHVRVFGRQRFWLRFPLDVSAGDKKSRAMKGLGEAATSRLNGMAIAESSPELALLVYV